MTCTPLRSADGALVGFACSRGRRRTPAPCEAPGCRTPHGYLCDKPVGPRGRLCSRKMCDEHRVQIGPDRDYCLPCGQPELDARAELKGATP